MSVQPRQRFAPSRPCPICGGHDSGPRGTGVRCFGFLSDDGRYANCTRPEHAGTLAQHPSNNTYGHRLEGACGCGLRHGAAPIHPVSTPAVHRATPNTPPVAPPTTTGSTLGKIVATYKYHDEDGTLLYEVVRYEPKTFRQRQPAADGGWTWNLDRVRRVVYRLPELTRADADTTVYLCEGEKDCDNVRALGLTATTNAGGAEKWMDSYTAFFTGHRVVILPHNDDAGRRHARKVAGALRCIARDVRVLELPGLEEKGDASDWIAAGGTRDELARMAAAAPPSVALPDKATLLERFKDLDRDELLRRLVDATHEVAVLQSEKEQADGILGNATLSPPERIVALGLAREVTEQSIRGTISPDKDVKLFFPKLAERTGLSTDTVGRTVKALARTGAHSYQAVREIQEGQPVTRSYVTIASNPDAYAHALSTPAPDRIAPDGRVLKHGGARVCHKCGGLNLVPALLCRDCGHAEEEREVEQKIADRHRLARGRRGPDSVPRPLPQLAAKRDASADIHPIGSAVVDRAPAHGQDPDEGAPIALPHLAAKHQAPEDAIALPQVAAPLSINGEGPQDAVRSDALWDALAAHDTPPRQTYSPGRRCCHEGCLEPVKHGKGHDHRWAWICTAGHDQARLALEVGAR